MAQIDLSTAVKDSELTAATSVGVTDTLSIIQGGSNKKVTTDLLPANTKRAYNALSAFAIDITKDVNTKSIASDATFTFSGTPTTGQRTSIKITTDATDRTVTLPSFWCRNRQELVTEVVCFKSSTYIFEFEYTGSRWESDSYALALRNYDKNSVQIGHNIGYNFSGTACVFIGASIANGTVDTVPTNPKATNITDSVFIGVGAGETVGSGNGNLAIGRLALGRAITSDHNTAVGDTALHFTTAANNTALGYESGAGNVTGNFNVFVGSFCGGVTNDKGDHNICIGGYAGDGILGTQNILIGNTAGPSAGGACDYNVGIGFQVLNNVTTGDRNIAIGRQAGLGITTGSDNLFLGYRSGSDGQLATAINSIAIGPSTQTDANYQMVLGHTDITKTLIRGSEVRVSNGFLSVASYAQFEQDAYTIGNHYFKGTTGGAVNAKINGTDGSLELLGSTTAKATLRVPHGTAPTSPVNGDIWTTSAGMFVRINGVTKSINLT